MIFFKLLILFFVSGNLFLYGQESEIKNSSIVNWEEDEIIINFETIFPPGSETIRIRNNSEEIFRNSFFSIFLESIKRDVYGPLYFSSDYTVEEMVNKTPDFVSNLNTISESMIKVYSVYNPQMTGMEMQYILNIYQNIAFYFINHSIPVKPAKTLIWVPSEEYTGIIVYAVGEFPIHGENRKSTLKPAFFPAVYDEKMRKISGQEMTNPEFLRRWGTAGYFSDPEDPRIKERVGDNPLRTMAREIYGNYPVDIIIPSADGEKLFYLGRNEKLIAEGRIVIICTLPSDMP